MEIQLDLRDDDVRKFEAEGAAPLPVPKDQGYIETRRSTDLVFHLRANLDVFGRDDKLIYFLPQASDRKGLSHSGTAGLYVILGSHSSSLVSRSYIIFEEVGRGTTSHLRLFGRV
jgi:hypothetical protein